MCPNGSKLQIAYPSNLQNSFRLGFNFYRIAKYNLIASSNLISLGKTQDSITVSSFSTQPTGNFLVVKILFLGSSSCSVWQKGHTTVTIVSAWSCEERGSLFLKLAHVNYRFEKSPHLKLVWCTFIWKRYKKRLF